MPPPRDLQADSWAHDWTPIARHAAILLPVADFSAAERYMVLAKEQIEEAEVTLIELTRKVIAESQV